MGEAATLIGTPLAPVPAGGRAEWVRGDGDVRLRTALFEAAGARGSVIVSPGRTEPIEKYFEVVEDLRSRRFTVLVHDWRGHGLSQRLHRDPLRGHATGTDAFLVDHRLVLDAYETRLPRPWIALGHSMGGGLVAASLLAGERRITGAVLSAPMMGVQLGFARPGFARLLCRLLAWCGLGGAYAIGRGDPLGGTFEKNILTHDRRRWERTLALLTAAPELQVAGVTWDWLAFALDLALRLEEDRPICAPVAIVTAGDERLVDNAATRAFAGRHPDVRCVEIEGAFHELLMETDAVRARFWSEFDALVARA